MLTVAFGVPTTSRIQVQLRYIQFKEGPEDANHNNLLVARAHQQPIKALKQS